MAAGEQARIRLRLVATPAAVAPEVDVGSGFDAVLQQRRQEADEFYAELAGGLPADRGALLRQALAGPLWSKQFYHYDVGPWLDGDPGQPAPPPGRGRIRNGDWRHLSAHDVIVMPDVWEYPWFAAWDLAFHCVTLAHVDPAPAKAQLVLMLPISAFHREHPFVLDVAGRSASVDYEPGESTTTLYGGNSNCRGPVWLPLNVLLIEALRRYHDQFGAAFTVEFPTGSGRQASLGTVADELARRLVGLFLRDEQGARPADGANPLAESPRWRDQITFYEYFHGDNGTGLGASHQTGRTALVAHLLLTTTP